MNLKLVKKKACFIKASSVAKVTDNNQKRFEGYVFNGWSGSGKTDIMLKLVRNGFYYVSDTFSMLDRKGYVYPLPFLIHIFNRNLESVPELKNYLKLKNRISMFVNNLIFSLSGGRYNISTTLEPKTISTLPPDPLPLKKMFIIEDSESDVHKISVNEAIEKIIATYQYESYYMNNILMIYNYIFPKENHLRYLEDMKRIITSALKNHDHILVLSSNTEVKSILNLQ